MAPRLMRAGRLIEAAEMAGAGSAAGNPQAKDPPNTPGQSLRGPGHAVCHLTAVKSKLRDFASKRDVGRSRAAQDVVPPDLLAAGVSRSICYDAGETAVLRSNSAN
jgi:hypothetical protein